MWLVDLWVALGIEYRRRYDKEHLSISTLYKDLLKFPINIPHIDFTPPPQAMPDHCKIEDDCVAAYRKYYIIEKAYFARWKKGKNYLDIWSAVGV
tara:strand:+ start:52 stop:336 length:285 start_codon:yes stop_codon:yes gene_type:complete